MLLQRVEFNSTINITLLLYLIIKKELYSGIFNEICNIEFNKDFVLPIYIVPYTEIFVKITFDDIVNIPGNIKLTYTGGLLQNEYRKNRSIIYPLSNYIDNGCIIPILHEIKKFNIIIKFRFCNEFTNSNFNFGLSLDKEFDLDKDEKIFMKNNKNLIKVMFIIIF